MRKNFCGDGQRFLGASLNNENLPQTPAILASAAPASGQKVEDATLCKLNSLDPAKVKGKVVVCDRGVNPRTEKSAEAKRAGAAGMVLKNLKDDGLSADDHAVPAVHIDHIDGPKLQDYVTKSANPTVALEVGNTSGKPSPPSPQVAGFSSRGPALAADSNLLKPDIAAPGVDVLAAVSPTADAKHNSFGFMSGTSMSSPHIAGLAALIYGKNPNWSPMTIKSAMMTTARDTVEADGTVSSDHFAAGAGFVNPKKFYNPGLVYKSDVPDWLGYLRGQGANVTSVDPIRAVDLNLPSFAVSKLAGSETVTRTVTAMAPGKYSVKANVPGFNVKVEPSTLEFAKAGEAKQYKVTFTRTDAPLAEFSHGWLTWSGTGNEVRSPVSLRPVAIAPPNEVAGKKADGSVKFQVIPGSSGSLDLKLSGLAAAQVQDDTVKAGAADFSGKPNDANRVYTVQIPEGTKHFRAQLVAGEGSTDLDMVVRNAKTGAYVPDEKAGTTSQASETIDVPGIPAGEYQVIVNGYAIKGDAGKFSLRLFTVPAKDEGNATLSPNPLKTDQGKPAEVTAAWKNLGDKPYLGIIEYGNTGTSTLLTVD